MDNSQNILNRSNLKCAALCIVKMSTDLGLSSVLVLGQINPRDGAKRSEELLQICLTGVLGQVGHTDGGIVISCQVIHSCLYQAILWLLLNAQSQQVH